MKKRTKTNTGIVHVWNGANQPGANIGMIAYDMENPEYVGIELELEGYEFAWYNVLYDKRSHGKSTVRVFLKVERMEGSVDNFNYEARRVAGDRGVGDVELGRINQPERYRISVTKTRDAHGKINSCTATWELLPTEP